MVFILKFKVYKWQVKSCIEGRRFQIGVTYGVFGQFFDWCFLMSLVYEGSF